MATHFGFFFVLAKVVVLCSAALYFVPSSAIRDTRNQFKA